MAVLDAGFMNVLYLCRHGETDWNAQGRIQGRTDTRLNAAGHAQAERLAHVLLGERPRASLVVSSPMCRAVETARHIADLLDVELVCDEDLTELHTGRYTGCVASELASDPRWQAHLRDHWIEGCGEEGEPAVAVRERVMRAVERYRDRHVVVVSHATPIRHIIMGLLDMPNRHLYHLVVGNASVTRFDRHDAFSKLVYMNYMDNLFSDKSL